MSYRFIVRIEEQINNLVLQSIPPPCSFRWSSAPIYLINYIDFCSSRLCNSAPLFRSHSGMQSLIRCIPLKIDTDHIVVFSRKTWFSIKSTRNMIHPVILYKERYVFVNCLTAFSLILVQIWGRYCAFVRFLCRFCSYDARWSPKQGLFFKLNSYKRCWLSDMLTFFANPTVD